MRKIFVLAPALLLAGCRSEQVAFPFQRAASAPVAAPRASATASTLDTTALVVAPAAPMVAATRAGRPALPPRRVRVAARLLALPPLATARPRQLARQAARHLGRRHPTEGAAENGLGSIGLFFIGVVLGILAGLAALVNVIFGVGFFTGLGYAAAGLVVLGLLYLLLSGGKKKK